jgi:hypothetical protein
MRRLAALGLAAGTAVFSACAKVDFQQARHLEEVGQPARAVKAYESFLSRRPGGLQEAEALVRAAMIYAEAFGRCERAVPLFERAARLSSYPEWASKAKDGLLDCPDYFPIRPGARWVYVDSESGGQNMKLDIQMSTGTRARITGAYFAGENRFRDYSRSCEKKDWIVWEFDGAVKSPILRYPFHAGSSWSARVAGKNVLYRIEDASAEVRTKAGAFKGCLKVRAHPAGEPAWVYDYYCPGVGRVKTTVGVEEGENPNTELAESSLLHN